MSQPTKYFKDKQIPSSVIDSLFLVLGFSDNENEKKDLIKETLANAIHNLNSFSGIQYYDVALVIEENFTTTVNVTKHII
jgi:hypothetical protein